MSTGHLSQDEVSPAALKRLVQTTKTRAVLNLCYTKSPIAKFFDRLAQIFDRRKGADHGAVYLTQKPLSSRNPMSVNEEDDLPTHKVNEGLMPLIIRATNGKSKRERDLKVKISTIVQPHDIDIFYIRYADICKSGMAALKPRDRSKKKAKAKKKKTVS
ncbi:hypothetical protein E4U21_001636 [Claviceps maximensis]|nr:hypothetical protein E4U21_001636 [Claviceps maximensis]